MNKDPSTAWTSDPGPVEPRMQLAENLESADARTFVYVDDSGRVLPIWRYRARQLGSVALLTSVMLLGGTLLTWWLDALGILLWLVLVAFVLHLALLWSWIQRGVVLLAHDRLAAADRLLGLAERFSLFQLGVRALALQNRAGVAQRRGDHRTALELNQRALALREKLPGFFRKNLHYWLLRYADVVLLCNLGRTDEARSRLAAITDAPPGEYIALRRWTAELYLALCDQRPEIDDAELERRSLRAFGLKSEPELLALCAWAWHARGDLERADRYLVAAGTRGDPAPIAEGLPALASWMNAVRRHDDRTTLPDPPGDAS